MNILVFGKPSCAKCRTTKRKLGHFLKKWGVDDNVALLYHDLETADGMTEGAFRDVLKMPTVIVEDDERELARWAGKPPKSEEIKNMVATDNAQAT